MFHKGRLSCNLMNLENAVANSQLTFTMTFTKDGETEPTTESTETTTEAVETTTEAAETTTESTETTTEAAETTTESTETTTEAVETTTEAAETTTEKQEPVEITMDQEFNADGDRELGGYTIYVGQSWNGSTAVAGVDAEDGDHIKVQQKTSNWVRHGAYRLRKNLADLYRAKYSISWKINAESNDGKVLVTNNEAQIALVGGEQVLTGEFTATESGTGEFVVGMGCRFNKSNRISFAPEITKISDPGNNKQKIQKQQQKLLRQQRAQEETTTKLKLKQQLQKQQQLQKKQRNNYNSSTNNSSCYNSSNQTAKVTVKKVAIKKATKKKSVKKVNCT